MSFYLHSFPGLSRSLSEEKLVECEGEAGEDEVSVVRSEGEETGSEGEGEIESRLQGLQALQSELTGVETGGVGGRLEVCSSQNESKTMLNGILKNEIESAQNERQVEDHRPVATGNQLSKTAAEGGSVGSTHGSPSPSPSRSLSPLSSDPLAGTCTL